MSVVVAAGISTNASALSVTDPSLVGTVLTAQPSSDSDQILYINVLRLLGVGGTATIERPPVGPDNDTTLLRSLNLFADLPVAVEAGAFRDETSPYAPIDLGLWDYVYAKYGNDAYVWYVGDLTGVVELDASVPGVGGLSHYSLYNATSVPDGGATMMLVGMALLGIGAVRRRMVA